MNQPKVSVGLPVYNGESYLKEAIESILQQTYEDFELVLLDNASTDCTSEICRKYAAQDSRIRYHRNRENIGHTGNINRAVQLTRGQYYRQHHDDDIMEPRCLERCVEVLEKRSEVVLCHTKTTLIGPNGEPRDINRPMDFHVDNPHPHQRLDKFMRQCYPNSGLLNVVFGMVRRDALLNAPDQGAFPHADAALYAGLTLWGAFHVVDEHLFRRRDHPGRSGRAFENEDDLLHWLNPDTDRYQFPKIRFWGLRNLLKAIWEAPITATDRVRCMNVVYHRYIRHFYRQILGEIRRGVQNGVASAFKKEEYRHEVYT